jgi:metal-dependent amidase/aminoacylase/carboxypeptidase family protein
LSGTLRAHDPEVRESLIERVRRIVAGIGAAYNVDTEISLVRGYPPVINDAALSQRFAQYVREHSSLQV